MNNRPRIIELVGLAGSGKSTLVKSLQRQNDKIQIFPLPRSWFLWSLTKRSILWVPLGLQRNQLEQSFTREELTSIGCIDAWLPFIQLKTSANDNIAVMDPGSVYWLTKLQGFGSDLAGRSLYRRWLEDRFEQWSSALDVIIWLDAPEELCLQRVLAREQWHDAKAMPSDDVLSRFRRLRSSYEQIIDTMVSRQPKKVFHFRTDEVSTEEMVEQIVSEVDLAPRSQAHTGPKINNSALHTSC